MKLSNIFKKSTKTVAKATIETLAKNQLEKVIGGGGPDAPVETNSTSGGGKKKGGGTVTGTVVINSGNL
jgi:hypothetical protein